MEIRELIEKIVKEMEEKGGLKNVVWVAAGGSNDGHYAAQYFMDRESTAVRSQMITSSEFEFAAPKCIGENTIAVITSMRGTKETIEAAKVAKNLELLQSANMLMNQGLQKFAIIMFSMEVSGKTMRIREERMREMHCELQWQL